MEYALEFHIVAVVNSWNELALKAAFHQGLNAKVLTELAYRDEKEYVQEVLQQGYIQPSISPASARFFFVEKKGGKLRPCFDYQSLNQILIKYTYPLPPVIPALEQLHSATHLHKN